MEISCDFEGGNILVEKIEGNNVYLRPDLRDTGSDWFYWCFKVKNAGGTKLKFIFHREFVGYYGAGISHDNYNYDWQYNTFGHNGDSFEYQFKNDENEVYFCHDIAYREKRFINFCKENNLSIETFCKSQKGRDIPFVQFGNGEKIILLTARHHACESTGSYVLQGLVKEFLSQGTNNYKILYVPFVDYDGVIDGDQGKDRLPHDHNRDYIEEPLYHCVKKLKEILKNNNVEYIFDFHSPWHIGGDHDTVYIVTPCLRQNQAKIFSEFLESSLSANAMQYHKENNYPPYYSWNNVDIPNFTNYAQNYSKIDLCFSFETAYFGEKGNKFTPERGYELGSCFYKAFVKYLKLKNKNSII